MRDLSEATITAQWPCEDHGELDRHYYRTPETYPSGEYKYEWCPGGSRVLMTPREEEWCEVHRTATVNASGECPLAHHETPRRACKLRLKLLVDLPQGGN